MSVLMIPSYDMDYMTAVLKDPEMWERSSFEGQDKDSFFILPRPTDIFVKALIDGVPTGFYWLHPLTECSYQIHANILLQYRNYSKELSSGIIDWCRHSLPAKTLVAHIPEVYQDVYRHTLSMGFKDVGLIPNAAIKHGEPIGVHVLARGLEQCQQQH